MQGEQIHQSQVVPTEPRTRAEEAGSIAEAWRKLVDHSLQGLMILQEGRIVFANPAAANVTGYSVDEMLSAQGEALQAFIHPEDRQMVWQRHRDRLAGRPAPENYEFRIAHKSGDVRWVEIHTGAIEYRGHLAIQIAMTDVTDRKRAQEQARLRQMELLHVSRLSTLGEMASGLAHELSQPLAAIQSYAGASIHVIQAEAMDKGALMESLQQIVVQSMRAGEIIRRIRAFAQRRQPCLSPLGIHAVIRDVVGFLRADMAHKGIEMTLELSEDLPLVLGDSIQLEQALLNLMRNSVEAMETVDTRARRLVVRTIEESDGNVMVAVSDTGVGLDPQVMPRIFDPFFTTKADGLGIGLSITGSIIELHKGRLWAEPNCGPGCTFAFTLPIARS